MSAENTSIFSDHQLKINPQELVEKLDQYIIGQHEAKKEIAIAIRNRWRRKKLPKDWAEEITPLNILMMGPTGVGKTEIARRISQIMNFPFNKVNATDYTTRGYHGMDVDHMLHGLIEDSIKKIKTLLEKKFQKTIKNKAQTKLQEIIKEHLKQNKEEFDEKKFNKGEYDKLEVEIEVAHNDSYGTLDIPGLHDTKLGIMNISDVLSKAIGGIKNKKTRKCTVKEAILLLTEEESEKIIDEEDLMKNAIEFAENYGIIFIDEIDKIIENKNFKTDVNREGVQRDLLPLVEGSIVNTKFGNIKTDHILFITAGAFHLNQPSELLPELQGRLPVHVKLNPLSSKDLEQILTTVKFNIIEQQQKMFHVEGIDLQFSKDAITEIANITYNLNQHIENIGARRLYLSMDIILKELNFTFDKLKKPNIKVNKKYVQDKMTDTLKELDLKKFIL